MTLARGRPPRFPFFRAAADLAWLLDLPPRAPMEARYFEASGFMLRE